MSQVTKPIMLDETGQAIATALGTIAADNTSAKEALLAVKTAI